MFYSILFPTKEQYEQPRQTQIPVCFKDLNLNQIFEPILKIKKEFELESFFYSAQTDIAVIKYRQDVTSELEDDILRTLLANFSETIFSLEKRMMEIRTALSSKDSWSNNYVTRGRILDHADRYCCAVSELCEKLNGITLHSEGLCRFKEYLDDYCSSNAFISLREYVKKLRDEFSTIRYCMLIKNGTIRVRKYEGQTDHSQQILACFAKFRQGDVNNYRQNLPEEPLATHVEAAVLRMLSGLYKDIFEDLDRFCIRFFNFDDEVISRFSREIQFYLSWLDFILPLRKVGLSFCYPRMCTNVEHLYDLEGFDLALASFAHADTVVNDFHLTAPEHIIVVTGPNQGGKTTFARTFGQIHWLASLGLCVPGREAELLLFDQILTHFGREEDLSTLNGKLQDDLVRLHQLLNAATDKSVIIVNEIFASTTLNDALVLGNNMMDAFAALGAPAVVVTFLDELATHGPETVSMMSTIKENDPTQRTFKIIRKPPDGLAYAMQIAGKHGLTYEQLCGRLRK